MTTGDGIALAAGLLLLGVLMVMVWMTWASLRFDRKVDAMREQRTRMGFPVPPIRRPRPKGDKS